MQIPARIAYPNDAVGNVNTWPPRKYKKIAKISEALKAANCRLMVASIVVVAVPTA
jgi:hypothetical protein